MNKKIFIPALIFIVIFIGFFSLLKANKSFFLGIAIEGVHFSKTELSALKKEVGFKPGIIMFYLVWPDIQTQNEALFPEGALKTIWENKALPCLSWEPKGALAEDILKGHWDDYLEKFAEGLKAFKKPVIIRFAHEMNLEHYHWGVKKTNYNYKTPALYQKLFRYVYTFFQKREVSNALLAFSPNADSIPNLFWNRIAKYYPGDKYVDIIGLDGYNFGTSMNEAKDGWDSSWQSFDDIFYTPYQELKKAAPKKPFFIFETGSSTSGGNREAWLEKTLDIAQKWEIKGLIWFQVDKETDWRMMEQEKKIIKKSTYSHSAQKWAKKLVREKRKANQ